jgi:hypothetical protein
MTSEEVCELTGITYRQLVFWSGRGYLKPCGEENRSRNGSGIPWVWTMRELEVAARMGTLVAAGLRASVAAEVARSGKRRYRLSDQVTVEGGVRHFRVSPADVIEEVQ